MSNHQHESNGHKKRWPADYVMIVASRAGEEIRAQMESVVVAHCRDCGAKLHADSYAIRTAQELPERQGRPVAFFCTPALCSTIWGNFTKRRT